VLAVTAQQSFGIVVALLVTVGWILYLVANVKKAKPEIGSSWSWRPTASRTSTTRASRDRASTGCSRGA
jgi:hypothetical protein